MKMKGNLVPIQNLGLADRFIRFFGGGALLAIGVVTLTIAEIASIWSAVAILLSVYPLMTTVMGWDPFYQMMGTRTCSVEEGRTQCGTFPYEMDAALGHNPHPEEGYEYDRSLGAAHHEGGEQKKKAA
jgi:hypothetical protein